MSAPARRYNFKGLMAPIFSIFNGDGSLNLGIIPRYAQLLHDNGITGVFVCGTMGEGASMTTAERKKVTEAWVKCRDMVGEIVIQVGGASLYDAKELARHAVSLGVSAVSCWPPLYDKPDSVEALVDYCREVASVAPEVPFLYYHIPCKTDVEIPMDQFLEAAAPVIPNLAGMKFTSMEVLTEGARCVKAAGGVMTMLSGFDQTMTDALSVGFPAVINGSFNWMGLEAGRLFCLATLPQDSDSGCCVTAEERKAEMERIQARMSAPWASIAKHSANSVVTGAKVVMTLLTGLPVGPARKPQKAPTLAVVEAIKSDLQKAGFTVREDAKIFI